MTVRIGYASGVYDLFHIGHLNLLKHARQNCDYLIAGVVSADSTMRQKSKEPVVPLHERLEIVRNIRLVDEVVVDDFVDKVDAWRAFGFNVFFKGDDWRGTEKGLRLEAGMQEVGVEVVYFPYTVHTSSTMLRRALNLLGGGLEDNEPLEA
ncbi:adenylyltransferase/cytidyltransferase family protein [Pseudarthrobacter sp. MM222]|jgi:glycerol-3-phosphate cytidylyltransferase|uniref:adenylyltransferase/cytidyltransferase family protein n=1 Tax=Pseudarthrobacter sp. MM222 TaxID=3018929 RepID=UPI00222056E6|nr:adenylyltransferase/cytidyltransferase family protein [Pseudarthrobacter sp. MM222]CAI3804892.1 Glycerol-3-phosphate cytidylyltransferase [Pseudarthrobacter sp. MM222]